VSSWRRKQRLHESEKLIKAEPESDAAREAFAEVRRLQLYREDRFSTLENYCRARLGWEKKDIERRTGTPRVARSPKSSGRKLQCEEVVIGDIQRGTRYRKELGDISALAKSIQALGLLEPIGIDSRYRLIFGMRRLLACQEIGWGTIPCVILKLDSLLEGQYAENELRKEFAPSERAAIARAMKEEVGNRRGARTDLGANAPKLSQGRTENIAAHRAGFKSRETSERAQAVVERGSPELIRAMDSGELSIAAAAFVAGQPVSEQARILQMEKGERRKAVRQMRNKDKAWLDELCLFRGLYDAVHLIAEFSIEAKETWAAMTRVAAYGFSGDLERAAACLARLQREHPNEPLKPKVVVREQEGA
jgi:ParB family chromosome partitioning protein